ncbi:MAG: nitroreductase family protein [Kordiimonadaceae bacterium]|nr:nitroreductase family protein [Kordiimonadaceae bacterium]
MNTAEFMPLEGFERRGPEQMIERSHTFFDLMKTRRTVRSFSEKPVPKEVIENAILTAGRAPSGANKQPWHFSVIADPSVKALIRAGAEEEEREFYGGKASDEWLKDVKPFATDANKDFLEIAPYVIAVFRENYSHDPVSGKRCNNYYVTESIGIACGFLLTALHQAGLATLTHTPSPMGFLSEVCGRPINEKPVMLVVVGYPEKDVKVPVISKKPLKEITSWI